MQQHEALTLLKMGKNVFLTGAAGSGKTYVLNQYINYLKEHQVTVAVTASTGLAATHLQGMTIHAWSGIGINDHISEKHLEKLAQNDRIKRNYQKTKVLIIDEISMLHAYQLDMLDTIARSLCNNDQPFGGIQLVLCGDFFQLPPVSNSSAKETKFAFESETWQNAHFQVCYLHEQHRQCHDPLLDILNDIRSGTAGEHTKVPLRTRYKKEPQGATKPTKLYSRNINVDVINEKELSALSGVEKTFVMTTDGFKTKVDHLKKSCLALDVLKLKIGAQVMFIKNDVQGRYVNGTRSVVVGFDKTNGWPIVKTYTDEIIIASPEEWKLEENGIIRAMITQVPLRLAWAITIHKSQGMTLDAAEIDLGDAFEPGMGYVALSRVRTLTGLKLMNLNDIALKVHPKILVQDQILKSDSQAVANSLNTLSDEELLNRQNDVLIKRFGGKKTKQPKILKSKKIKVEKVPTHMITLQLLQKDLSIQAIAKEREMSERTILTHIEKLNGLKLLDQDMMKKLKNMIETEAFDLILSAFKESTDGFLKPIYDKFDGRYPYQDLQIVRMFSAS